MEQTATQSRKSDSWLPTGEPAKKSKLLPLKSVNIVSKQSRQKAKATTYSKYERIRKGLAIGWRMNTNRQGSWTARRMTADGYQFGVIGHSDEVTPADGVTVFSYDQAEAACVAWAANADSRPSGGPWRVRDAAKDWLDIPSTKGGSKDAGRSNVKNWINPMLGDVPVVDLTKAQLQKFLHDIANSPSKKNTKNYDAADAETIRRGQDRANRIFHDLAALLTKAFKDRDEITSNAAWEKVETFSGVAKQSDEFLIADEVQLVLDACEDDFKALVFGAVVTGYRYGDLASILVKNFNANNRSVGKTQRKTKMVNHVFLSDSETEFFAGLAKGKKPSDKLFTKADRTAWLKDDQRYRLAAALKKAGIQRHVRFHDLRHTAASLLAAGKVDLAYISKHLGHSSQRVTERYRHLVESHLAETIRAAKPAFATTLPSNGRVANS